MVANLILYLCNKEHGHGMLSTRCTDQMITEKNYKGEMNKMPRQI